MADNMLPMSVAEFKRLLARDGVENYIDNFIQMIKQNEIETFKQFFDSDVKCNNLIMRNACRFGRLDMVQHIYKVRSKEEINKWNSDYYDIVEAAFSGNQKLVEFLIESGTNLFSDDVPLAGDSLYAHYLPFSGVSFDIFSLIAPWLVKAYAEMDNSAEVIEDTTDEDDLTYYLGFRKKVKDAYNKLFRQAAEQELVVTNSAYLLNNDTAIAKEIILFMYSRNFINSAFYQAHHNVAQMFSKFGKQRPLAVELPKNRW